MGGDARVGTTLCMAAVGGCGAHMPHALALAQPAAAAEAAAEVGAEVGAEVARMAEVHGRCFGW